MISKKLWINYANFKDRSTISDYWWVILCNILVGIILGFITRIAGSLSFISSLYTLAFFIPTLALSVKRLHDINKSGWTYLLVLIPLV